VLLDECLCFADRRDSSGSTRNDGNIDGSSCDRSISASFSRSSLSEGTRLTKFTSLDLVSESIDNLRLRTDEKDSSFFYFASEFGVLREETVTRVNHGNSVLFHHSKSKISFAQFGEVGFSFSRLTSLATYVIIQE